MLVIIRRIGETVMIGDAIEVVVLGRRGQRIRIGINAPAQIAVDRPEVRVRKQANHLRASALQNKVPCST